MTKKKQLWLLTGGNGSGKSTFHRLFLEPPGIKLINADLIAREIDPENPEKVSYEALKLTAHILKDLLRQGASFSFETVFSHESKIDITANAKAMGYEIILVYIHLETVQLNIARVSQRVTEGGHNVPADKIEERIPRTMKNIITALHIVDEARLFDNSSRDNPFRQVAIVKKGARVQVSDPLPSWADDLLRDI